MKIDCSRALCAAHTDRRTLAFLGLLSEPKTTSRLELTADDLDGADTAPVPLAGHLDPGQLGAGQHPGELGVLGAEVLVQVAADTRCDLECSEECEEDAEQDVQTPDDEGCHDDEEAVPMSRW